MIRGVAVISLLSLLILVLYLPAAHPPERFLQQLRLEMGRCAEFWGEEMATDMLDKALGMQTSARGATALPSSHDAPSTKTLGGAVATEMGAVNQRLFNNAYFRSVEALFMLASFRLAMMLQWLPWLSLLALPLVLDGHWHRVIKAKEFRQHDPEMFAIWACFGITGACATVLGLVFPITLHPLVMPGSPVVILVLAGLAWRSYHRR
jgi:hypothetical protein